MFPPMPLMDQVFLFGILGFLWITLAFVLIVVCFALYEAIGDLIYSYFERRKKPEEASDENP